MAPHKMSLATSNNGAEMSSGVRPSQDDRPLSSARPLSHTVQQSEGSLSLKRSSKFDPDAGGLCEVFLPLCFHTNSR